MFVPSVGLKSMKSTRSGQLVVSWQKFLMFKTKSSPLLRVHTADIASYTNGQPALLETLLIFSPINKTDDFPLRGKIKIYGKTGRFI